MIHGHDARLAVEPVDAPLAELEAAWEDEPSPWAVVIGLLGEGRVYGFDCEAGVVPVDHAGLIRDLAQLARGILAVEAVSQVVDGEGRSTVRFVVGDTLLRFEPEDLGDWYDVAAVVGALNAALERLDARERYLLLHTGDQSCLVVFVRAQAFRAAAAELRIPIERDADAARRTGVAFEEYVRSMLQDPEGRGA
jgi:hypothetical protein